MSEESDWRERELTHPAYYRADMARWSDALARMQSDAEALKFQAVCLEKFMMTRMNEVLLDYEALRAKHKEPGE